MGSLLPFGFPGATAFYLSMYVLTLVIHVVFMNYVLAGVGYLTVASFRRKPTVGNSDTVTMIEVLRDWMPFATSAAITAGVAPLLFVQILYKKNFYTANLLLFHRWMAILPLLIIGFYLLYLLKTRWMARQSPFTNGMVALGAMACFAFTGFSWTENHLLSTDSPAWPGLYERGSMVYFHRQLLPRLGMWAVGAIPTMCALVAWQFFHVQERGRIIDGRQPRSIARLAIVGALLSVICGGIYWRQLDPATVSNVVGRPAGPYLLMASIGVVLQLFGWMNQGRQKRFSRSALVVCSVGLGLTIIGMTAVREAIRLSVVDISLLYEQHKDAAEKGGLFVFLGFFILNAGLIAWCLKLTRSRKVVPEPGA